MIVLLAVLSVLSFGAVPDDDVDDRAAIQSTIDAVAASGGGDVLIPNGHYLIGRAGVAYYFGLKRPAGVCIRGESEDGAVLVQAPGMAASVRLLYVTGPGGCISNLTIEGNKEAQSADEHRAGIFAAATTGLVVDHVTLQGFTGDGIYLYTGVVDAAIRSVTAIDNDRNGVTMGGQVDGLSIYGGQYAGNRAQQIDSEPGQGATVNGVTIVGADIDGTGSNDYALTVSGTGPDSRSRGWTVAGNDLHGGILVVYGEDVVVAGNQIDNATTKPCLTAYRRSVDVQFVSNACRMTQTSVANLPGIDILGTGTGHTPDRISVVGNEVTSVHPASWGVRAQGAISVTIVRNTIHGVMGGQYAAGVFIRATSLVEPFRSAVVKDNAVDGYARSLLVAGNVASGQRARLVSLVATDAVIDSSVTPELVYP